MADEYEIRRYRADDKEGFLSLHRSVFDRPEFDETWFDWKYEENPYVDHIPIIVAEHGGTIVGTRAFFALDLSVNSARTLALQPCDTMVAADHRGQGLFTQMTEYAIDYYTDREPAFFFNFPNEKSGPGYLKLGWRSVDLPTYIRLQQPKTLVSTRDLDLPLYIAGKVGIPLVRGFLRLCDATIDAAPDISVKRYETVPVETLTGLYCEHVPDAIHAIRDERFYEWRTNTPISTFTTYVASIDGKPRSALMTNKIDQETMTRLQIADFLPLDPVESDRSIADHLLQTAIRDNRDVDVIFSRQTILPSDWLRRHGFIPRHYLPGYDAGIKFVVRTLDPEGRWEFKDQPLTAIENWRIADIERD